MHARETHESGPAVHRKPATRAQRRQAERQAAKHHANGRAGGISRPMMIAGVLIMLAALGVFGFAVIKQATATTALPPLVSSAAYEPAQTHLPVGAAAPTFTLRDVSGKSYSLAAQRGHPLLLEFFATWCPRCHAQAPAIARTTSTYGPKGLRVWAILANPYGPNYESSLGRDVHVVDSADLADYAQTYDANYPLLVDPQFATVNRYGAQGYPTIYLIDAKGKVAFVSKGQMPYNLLAQQVDRVMTPGK